MHSSRAEVQSCLGADQLTLLSRQLQVLLKGCQQCWDGNKVCGGVLPQSS